MKIEEIITSINNKKIIETSKLKNKKERYENREYIVEGIKIAYEYIKSRGIEEIIQVYIKEELYNQYISGKIRSKKEQIEYIFDMLTDAEKAKIYIVKENVYNKITNDANPEGIMLRVKMSENNFEVIKAKKHNIKEEHEWLNNGVKIVFENISDPGNLGTIIRTAVAVGLDRIYISTNSVDIYSHKVIRASAGMIFKIEIIENKIEDILESLVSQGFNPIKTTMKGKNLYTFTEEKVEKHKEKIAVFFGNEANGISEYLENNITESLSIPMENDTESLNLGISFSVIIYELYRKNMNKK